PPVLQQGFELVPLVIAVGDYVLTPQICVERKSLSDLFQSMSSGRLYNQVEAMLKHYKVPVLLIEFNPDKVRPCRCWPEVVDDRVQPS
ncbi:unnamed protein product, partial [Ectocarpus sp. 12 AP-2014]